MQFKDYVDIVQKLVAIGAIVVAGWWFLIRGEGLPRADITHEFHSACLNSDIRWVRVIIDVQNIGHVRLELANSEHRISQVLPLDRKISEALRDGEPIGTKPGRISWPELAHLSSDSRNEFLESGEIHTQYRDFLIPSGVKIIQVTSFFQNPVLSQNDQIVGWYAIDLHDVGDTKCA